MNRSLYIIKPEAMPMQETIRARLAAAGLWVIRAVDLVIPDETLDIIYTDLSPDLKRATQLFMGSNPCQVGEVSGMNAVVKLFLVSGQFTDPSRCEPDTIRGSFGVREPERIGTALYFKNAIHRPKTEAEARRDLATFSGFFESPVRESQ